MLKKEFSLALKGEPDAQGVFEGYASTFGGSPDSYGDVITPGAFAKSLVRHKREGTMPMMFFGHDAGELPIGDWLDMAEDGKGLWSKGRLAMDDPMGDRVFKALKTKRVRGLSIGYKTIKYHTDEKAPGVTHLDEIDLIEVSVVNMPSNRRSLVTDVKAEGCADLIDKLAAGDRLTEREFERLAKGLGLSNSQAERAARVHLKGQGEPAEAEDSLRFLNALRG